MFCLLICFTMSLHYFKVSNLHQDTKWKIGIEKMKQEKTEEIFTEKKTAWNFDNNTTI